MTQTVAYTLFQTLPRIPSAARWYALCAQDTEALCRAALRRTLPNDDFVHACEVAPRTAKTSTRSAVGCSARMPDLQEVAQIYGGYSIIDRYLAILVLGAFFAPIRADFSLKSPTLPSRRRLCYLFCPISTQ